MHDIVLAFGTDLALFPGCGIGATGKQAMEDALTLSVPLIAEVKQGQRWSDCKD